MDVVQGQLYSRQGGQPPQHYCLGPLAAPLTSAFLKVELQKQIATESASFQSIATNNKLKNLLYCLIEKIIPKVILGPSNI